MLTDTFIADPTMYNHALNLDHIPVVHLHNQVKQSAVKTDQLSSSILNSALRNFPIHAVEELPKNKNIVQTILVDSVQRKQ